MTTTTADARDAEFDTLIAAADEIGVRLRAAAADIVRTAADTWRHTAQVRRELLRDEAGAAQADAEAARIDQILTGP